jgi:hypothetical protein
MMNRFYTILIFICFGTLCNGQETVFKTLITKSNTIIKATVLETGRKFSSEDGVWNYCILCKIEECYKGAYKTGDSIRIEISRFEYSGKSNSVSDSTEIIQNGKELIFFLNKSTATSVHMCSDFKPYPIYSLVDLWLGVQLCNPEMIFYLKHIAKPR